MELEGLDNGPQNLFFEILFHVLICKGAAMVLLVTDYYLT